MVLTKGGLEMTWEEQDAKNGGIKYIQVWKGTKKELLTTSLPN